MRILSVGLVITAAALVSVAQQDSERMSFRVKYAIADAVYLEAGRNTGLAEGMKLTIKRAEPAPGGAAGPHIVAELQVSSVAQSSAVCDVLSSEGEIHRGDLAYLTPASVEELQRQLSSGSGRRYPQVVAFTAGDPLDEEARESVPKPPLPEINRAKGRIGFDYSGIRSYGTAAATNMQVGMMFQGDMTRLGGTYWNLSGYWRGRLNSFSGDQTSTVTDLINRTYHLSLTYDNPHSPWVAGFGRLLLPWAASLDTLDGGYAGRRFAKVATAGMFAGSTPDPTSWNYNPDRRLAGAFVNVEDGSYEGLRFSSTMGVAVSALGWRADRQFVFTENGVFYKQYFSLYDSLQADRPKPGANGTSVSPLSRSYVTARFQPHRRLSFDLSHNYFRDLPTFDPLLVSTGLVDKLIFQGFSGGVRVEPLKRISVYANIGRSSRTADTRRSLNQLYGITFQDFLRTGLRADVRYSSFDGSFGRGSYRAASLARNFGTRFRVEVQGGNQNFASLLTAATRSNYVTTTIDGSLGRHYFLQGSYTVQRGEMSYDQWYVSFGYRFDTRGVPR